MSGTSLDAVDAVLMDWNAGQALGFASLPLPDELRQALARLCISGQDELVKGSIAALDLASAYSVAVAELLMTCGLSAGEVRAIGSHGQTVRHHPELGFSIQLQNPARLAELTGIDVVADFRSRDLAAGGQGAPLVPVFHQEVFASETHARAIVNVGGISNVSLLAPGRPPMGFDCGPGNVLLDSWAAMHLGTAFDCDGRWGMTGKCIPALLEQLLEEPYLSKAPPKSTGRELFNSQWLAAQLGSGYAANDVQATLVEFTARCIVDAIARWPFRVVEVFVCGGGVFNLGLMRQVTRLAEPKTRVSTTNELGIPPQQVEAAAFSWLAKQAIERRPLDLTHITGAAHPCILGATYPSS